MPNTAAAEDPTEKKLLQIFVDVVDKPDIHVGVYSTPPGINRDGTDHIVVSLNKANPSTAKALEESDHDEIMRLVNWMLIHEMTRWQYHYPLARIREHVWSEAGKSPKEMAEEPGFFDIQYKPSPLLKAVAKLPIFGEKAELAQYDGAHLLAEIDITDAYVRKGHPAHRGQD
jgi:hypothetical protein